MGLAGLAAGPYGRALAKYDEMSKMADRFASNPIVVARVIARAVGARRARARYVAPRRTTMAMWMSAILPTAAWDWAMRKIGFLTPDLLDPPAASGAVPAPVVPKDQPAAGSRAAAN